MAGTAKRLRPDDLRILQQFQRERRRSIVRTMFFLALCLCIFLAGYAGMILYRKRALYIGSLNVSSLCFLVGFLGLSLVLLPLCSLCVRVPGIHALPRVLRWSNVLFLNISLLVSIPIVLLIMTIGNHFQFLHAGFFSDIAGECFCAAIIVTLLLVLTRRVLPFPRFSQVIRQIIIGTLLALFLACALGLLMPFAGLSLALTSTQLWQESILFLLLLPIFLLHEGVVHSDQEHATLPMFLLFFCVRGCFLIVVSVFILLSQEKKFIATIWPTPVIVFLFLQVCCFLLYREGRATIAGAIFSASITAWLLASHLTPGFL